MELRPLVERRIASAWLAGRASGDAQWTKGFVPGCLACRSNQRAGRRARRKISARSSLCLTTAG